MDSVNLKLDEVIEALEDRLQNDDLSIDEYEKLLKRLESLMKERNAAFRNEMDAVEYGERIELDKERLEKETEIGRKRNRNEGRRNVVELLKALVSVGASVALFTKGVELEYDLHNPINVPMKIWNFIPKIKN